MNYYVLESENNDNYPLLKWADRRSRAVARDEEVDTSTPVSLRLGAPIPKSPQMVDFHVLPEPVISDKIRAVLGPLKLHLVQFVPAEIDVEGTIHGGYSVVHVRNRVACLDMNRTVYQPAPSGGIAILEKIVLDVEKLGRLPERERLVFCPQEYSSVWLFHETVKRTIEAVRPVGLRFFHVRDWDDTVAFK